MKPKVLVLGGYGINCETETIFAFEKAGAQAEYVHINDLIDGTKNIDDFQIWAFPGGFSYGDHTGAGKAMANRISNNLREKILNFAKQDKLIIGICNGFQVLISLGLLPALDEKYGERQAGLIKNQSTKYQCEWVKIKSESQKCVWTKNINEMEIPIAHGEGNFIIDEKNLAKLKKNDQIVLKYIDYNPNGSIESIAGICDPSGKIFGLMPHPERNLFFHSNPTWTKKAELFKRKNLEVPDFGEGFKFFENGVNYFK